MIKLDRPGDLSPKGETAEVTEKKLESSPEGLRMTADDLNELLNLAGTAERVKEVESGILSGNITLDAQASASLDAALEGAMDRVKAKSDVSPEFSEALLTDEQIDEVFEGLDSYDFDGIDVNDDPERLEGLLEPFRDDVWKNLDVNEKKEAIWGLAEYMADVLGLDNPPKVTFFAEDSTTMGWYSHYLNEVSLNEKYLNDGTDAANTIAHEFWHSYQHKCAENPSCIRHEQYAYGFAHYVSPDVDFYGYYDQLVEAEARAFAGTLDPLIKN